MRFLLVSFFIALLTHEGETSWIWHWKQIGLLEMLSKYIHVVILELPRSSLLLKLN